MKRKTSHAIKEGTIKGVKLQLKGWKEKAVVIKVRINGMYWLKFWGY